MRTAASFVARAGLTLGEGSTQEVVRLQKTAVKPDVKPAGGSFAAVIADGTCRGGGKAIISNT